MSRWHATIPELDAEGLRKFGLTTGGILAALFGLLLPWLFGAGWPLWPWLLGGALVAWALVAPATLRVVYVNWMRFGLLMSKVTTPLILGLVFYLVIMPVGVVRHLLGHDSMARQLDENLDSYRIPSEAPPRKNLENPY
jgi:hypothetical protein